MKKVASKTLAVALGDFFESEGDRYILSGLTPKQFTKEPIAADTSARTVHNFGITTPIALIGATHDGAEVHLEGGGNYTIAASAWDDGQSLTFIHTAGAETTEKLIVSGFAGAYYRDGKSSDISAGLQLGLIVDGSYKATITNNGGQKYFNIWLVNDGITGTAGIKYAYPTAAARTAGTGYKPIADDVTEANLFLQLDTNTLWRITTFSPLAWKQVSATPSVAPWVADLAELTAIVAPVDGDTRYVKAMNVNYQFRSAYITDNSGNPTASEARKPDDGTVGVWLPESAMRPADDWFPAATNRNSLSTYYTRKFVGAPVRSIEFEVNEPTAGNLKTTKKVISIPDFPAVIAGTATAPDQQSVAANSGYYGGPTIFMRPTVDGGQSIVAVCVKPDGTVILYTTNAGETIAGLIRRVKINNIPVSPQFYHDMTIPDPFVPNTGADLIWTEFVDLSATKLTDDLPLHIVVRDELLQNGSGTTQTTSIRNIPSNYTIYLNSAVRPATNGRIDIPNTLSYLLTKRGTNLFVDTLFPSVPNVRWVQQTTIATILDSTDAMIGAQNVARWLGRYRGRAMFRLAAATSVNDITAAWTAAKPSINIIGVELVNGSSTTRPTGTATVSEGIYIAATLDGYLRFERLNTGATVNLAATDLGTFEPSGTGYTTYIPDRVGARIKSLTWTHYDRRINGAGDALYPDRFLAVTLTAEMLSGDGGWTLTLENGNRNTVRQTITLGGQSYIPIVQWLRCPGGTRFWFQESHNGSVNTFGGYESMTINWEVAA